jgi:D-serine deaminase-like pyridoxal phosphate-dependent protein
LPLELDQLPTPALLVDLDRFESNLARLAAETAAAGKKLRPHAKAHKCPEIARRQIAAGAVGICVATAAEAALMARSGIEDILLTSPLADPLKMAAVVATGAMVVVDHLRQVRWYQEAACAANIQVPVLIDLDPGDHRTGAATLEQAVEIALMVDQSSHLWLRGVQAYSVAGSHGKDAEERRAFSTETFACAAAVREACARHGLHTDVVSGGSTGTWDVDQSIPEVTEIQAGSYALMDLAYQRIGVDFEPAMSVLATVISANHSDFVTIDAGFKAFSTDRPFGPEPLTVPGASYRWGGDEFGYVELAYSPSRPKLGDKLPFAPPHCDPTVNLYDRIYACRGRVVEEVWPVMGRFLA